MAWIRMIREPEAEGFLAQLLRKLRRPGTQEGEIDSVDNVLKIHGLNPPTLRTHYDLYKSVMFGRSPLSRAQRETIAVVVSAANACRY